MGIEPTWDFVEPHTGFEDQERHQVAPHLHSGWMRISLREITTFFQPVVSRRHLVRFESGFQSNSIPANAA
jgi:hypothetical protein